MMNVPFITLSGICLTFGSPKRQKKFYPPSELLPGILVVFAHQAYHREPMLSPTARTLPVWIIIGLCVAFVLSSCREKPIVELPEGTQMITGTLKPAPLSLKRRGTHYLVENGNTLSYVESTAVSLKKYEGEEVTLEGTFVLNIDPHDLPVLVVTKVDDKLLAVKGVFVPSVKLRIDVPETWMMEKTASGALFTASGSSRSILAISQSALKTLPAGSPATVGGERAVRVIPAGSNDQVVYVLRGKNILTFTFTPSADEVLTAPSQFLKVLRSAKFEGVVTSQSASATTSGTGIRGQPCGGAAGILCPAGEYCSITDRESNTGLCVKGGR